MGNDVIYITPELRERVFTILKEVLPEDTEGKASPATGPPGMEQWKILVFGVLRQGLNVDYDRVHELANQHNTLRLMLGHSGWDDDYQYKLQTLKDNLQLFTPAILDRINQEVVQAGHALVKKAQKKASMPAVTPYKYHTSGHVFDFSDCRVMLGVQMIPECLDTGIHQFRCQHQRNHENDHSPPIGGLTPPGEERQSSQGNADLCPKAAFSPPGMLDPHKSIFESCHQSPIFIAGFLLHYRLLEVSVQQNPE